MTSDVPDPCDMVKRPASRMTPAAASVSACVLGSWIKLLFARVLVHSLAGRRTGSASSANGRLPI